ncbi:DUF3108 domain-containing protein [Jiella endophytica]|uniref:DUF3108 domain-containing protein n=1 Tax=Jiella endophytica TaxID=2558362 RepID=A0A4Y8RTT6_9HYPH|nr:DUF3108 domain-containing protein [Jiella endophytica]TFF27393.1 DUF3108 domain-containing protein [Jiella endophytica]
MRFRRIAITIATLGSLCLSGPPAGAADGQKVTTEYGMALIGLIIGKATFDTVIDDRRFSVSGRMSSAGLGSLVSKTGGTSEVSGSLASRGFAAERYGLDYTSDGKRWTSDVRFRSGRVTSSNVSPKRSRDEKPSYVPVERSQLASVVDPLSGLMIRTRDASSVCRRTLPLYDGWSRLDLKLSPGGTRAVSLDGFKGDAAVCKVRIAPVSGYDRKSRGLKFLQSQTIELWFAPIARPDVFVPVYARIPTTIGPLTLQATSVSVK